MAHRNSWFSYKKWWFSSSQAVSLPGIQDRRVSKLISGNVLLRHLKGLLPEVVWDHRMTNHDLYYVFRSFGTTLFLYIYIYICIYICVYSILIILYSWNLSESIIYPVPASTSLLHVVRSQTSPPGCSLPWMLEQSLCHHQVCAKAWVQIIDWWRFLLYIIIIINNENDSYISYNANDDNNN